jgi:SAM-dependent methyltransferase
MTWVQRTERSTVRQKLDDAISSGRVELPACWRCVNRLDRDQSHDQSQIMTTFAGPATPPPPGALDAPTEAFAVVRDALAAAQFDEPTVSARLGERWLYNVKRIADGRTTLTSTPEDANAVFVRLLIDGETLPTSLVERLLGADVLAALHALGVVAPAADVGASLVATVMLYPTQGLWLASDRQPMRVADMDLVPQDYVFSALSDLTQRYLHVVPDAPGGRVLELCAGTGIAALRAARRGAAEAWASDIVPRCVDFARFNVQLNDLVDRVRVVESDAWSALGGETFDLVVAHPPYVPALSHRFDFRDGGADGEQVARRIVEGLGAHVRPGGRFVMIAGLSDRRGAPIAARVREWLGAAGDAFDVVVLENGEYGPMEAYRNATKGGKDFVDCERWLRHFDALGVERFALSVVEMRRDAAVRAPITERRVAGTAPDHGAIDWVFRWARRAALMGPTPEARLQGQRPRVAPGARLAVHLESDAAGEWRTVGAVVETAWPTHALVKAPPLAPTLLELCDGTRDLAAILAGLREAGLVSGDVTRADVAHLVEVLAAAGALELSDCPIPAAASDT